MVKLLATAGEETDTLWAASIVISLPTVGSQEQSHVDVLDQFPLVILFISVIVLPRVK